MASCWTRVCLSCASHLCWCRWQTARIWNAWKSADRTCTDWLSRYAVANRAEYISKVPAYRWWEWKGEDATKERRAGRVDCGHIIRWPANGDSEHVRVGREQALHFRCKIGCAAHLRIRMMLPSLLVAFLPFNALTLPSKQIRKVELDRSVFFPSCPRMRRTIHVHSENLELHNPLHTLTHPKYCITYCFSRLQHSVSFRS